MSKPIVQSEWDRPKTIIVKKPGLETLLGSYHPKGSLFQGPFKREKAINEHKKFKETLQQHAPNVVDVEDILLQDETKLRTLTEQLLRIHTNSNLNKNTYDLMNKKELLQTVMLKPNVHVTQTDKNTGFVNNIQINPMSNLVFTRDQQITTDKYIVMGNMNSPQRKYETQVMKTVFDILGYENVRQLQNGKLEGGDFIPAGETAFIGQGLRTNEEGIQDLLTNNYISYDNVIVFKDNHKCQTEMHLDTYFNITSPNKAVLLENKMKGNDLTLDVYRRKGDRYVIEQTTNDVENVLRNFGYNIIPITKNEQLCYGINFLTVDKDKVIGVDVKAKERLRETYKKHLSNKEINDIFMVSESFEKIGESLEQKFKRNNIEYIPLDFNMLNMMYGSSHCMTQVVDRS